MTIDDVKRWAADHGFRNAGASAMAAPYGDLTVRMTFLRHRVRVEVLRGGACAPLGTYSPSGTCHISEHGMLEGMGLSASFISRFVGETGEKPVWMSDDYFRAVTGRGDEPALPGPR